jgi:hypothetical protein
VDDATQDETAIEALAGSHPAYPGGDKAQILEIMSGHFAAYDVVVTDQRPEQGDYTMVVFPSENPFGPGVSAIAMVDCGNKDPNNIAFVFHNDTVSTLQRAQMASGRVGATFGLDNHQNAAGLMYGADNADPDASFLDMCVEAFSPMCDHSAFCDTGSQNSHAYLTQLFEG